MLDVGTGNGFVLSGFADARVRIGIDIDHEALRQGASSSDARRTPLFSVADAALLPFADSSFDVVILYDVLEHVARFDDAVAEASRVLRPRGAVLVTAANARSPITLLDDPHSHLPLVSVLPTRLSKSIVEGLWQHREEHPGIHPRLPSWGSLHKAFARAGVRLELCTNLLLLEEPAYVVSLSHRHIAHLLQRLGVAHALRSGLGRWALFLYDRFLARSWTFVGVKTERPRWMSPGC